MSTNVRALQTSYEILRLTPDTTYKIAVAAVNNIGKGQRSIESLTLTLAAESSEIRRVD